MKAILKHIGQILIEDSCLTKDNLTHALDIQKNETTHRKIGKILIELGYVAEVDFLKNLGKQLGIIFLDDLSKYKVKKEILSKIPLSFVKKTI